jgi:hypothetical protein
MGVHWLDVLAPEFNGGTFAKSFVIGSYNGRVNFYEPMFSFAYLNSKPNDTMPIRQPQAYQMAGYYPTSYTISYDKSPKEFTISLNNLVYRPAS